MPRLTANSNRRQLSDSYGASAQCEQILRLRQVMAVTGLSRTSLWRLVRDDLFPTPVRLTKRAGGWHQGAVHEWIATRTPTR